MYQIDDDNLKDWEYKLMEALWKKTVPPIKILNVYWFLVQLVAMCLTEILVLMNESLWPVMALSVMAKIFFNINEENIFRNSLYVSWYRNKLL